ncbi:cellulase family glycosylhydrolase [Leptothrix discophora]|uniref:cellulase n=1 Tax=Leptothrix discophora TaxID=89 RepID=A0ABT9G8L1_LEPDI|nr:cellulase family glycosylhydrolase [Leptothrix discophora]MDP4302810.1 cellulase family glycosylhydrolase [Leptothrix discophora]
MNFRQTWTRGSLRAIFATLVAWLLACASLPAQAVGYSTRNGRIYDPAGVEMQIRGISHFGFNAAILQPQYLWAMGWKQQIAQIKSLGFNAVRLPFVPDTLYNTTPVNQLSYIDASLNPELIGKTPLQAMDLWMAEAERQGLYVMLDFHSVSKVRQYPTWYVSNPADFGLIHNGQAYPQAYWLRDLAFVARRYAALPHFFAIDIYNEPNGVVRWAAGDANMSNPANFWKPNAEAAAAAVLAANPSLLVFVQGINGNFDGIEDSSLPMNWGEDFQPQANQPLAIAAGKLVLTPHTYGPDVFMKYTFSAANFPANLPAQWDQLFGRFASQVPVVLGEWGGRYGNGTGGSKDVTWQNALVDYLIARNMRSTFYWCYTPNSGDSGGILDDYLAVRTDKMALLRKLWGSPATTGTTAPATPTAPGTTPAPAPNTNTTLVAPSIASYSPAVGPVGTVVTINGKGFTGANAAWAGLAHDAGVKVISDTQVQVTIPAGATSGAIGVFNPAGVAFTATGFSVSGAAIAWPQPGIMNFSPASGPVGTVVTVNGSGFTGANLAWVGNAHNGSVRVISDTQVQVTIPAGATSGAIGVFNPKNVAFTATAFTVR